MTVTGAPEVGAPQTAAPEADTGEPPSSAPPRPRLGARGVAAFAVLVAVVIVLLVLLFEGPVARQWYRTRQDHLASDLAVARAGLRPGQAATVVQAPRVGINAVVVEGDTPQNLRGGPGHRRGTPLPGRQGNAVIMGHRSGWGAPFSRLSRLRRGDLIVARRRTKDAVVYVVFKVTTIRSVSASDVRPLAQSTDHRLTLVTSAGGARSTRRLVVAAVSGEAGHLRRAARGLAAQTSGGSKFLNRLSLLALLALGIAAVAFAGLRRRHHVIAVVAIVTPLAALGLVCALLNLDLWLAPPLR